MEYTIRRYQKSKIRCLVIMCWLKWRPSTLFYLRSNGITVIFSLSCYVTDSSSPYLTEAQVSLIDTAECNRSTAYNGRISQDMFCARETEAAARMCSVRQTNVSHENGQLRSSLKMKPSILIALWWWAAVWIINPTPFFQGGFRPN